MALEQELASARLAAHNARRLHNREDEAFWNEQADNYERRLIMRDNPWDELAPHDVRPGWALDRG